VLTAKKQLRTPDSPYVHYGDSIALRSLKTSKYLSVATDGHGSVNVTSSTVSPTCIFVIQNADDEHDKVPFIFVLVGFKLNVCNVSVIVTCYW
jgi:hypothetical protein